MHIGSIKDPWHHENLYRHVFATMHMIYSFEIKMAFTLHVHMAICWQLTVRSPQQLYLMDYMFWFFFCPGNSRNLTLLIYFFILVA